MEIKHNINDLDFNELVFQLGTVDYTYLETVEYVEMLEKYRSDLLHEIKKRMKNGNSQNMDSGIRTEQSNEWKET